MDDESLRRDMRDLRGDLIAGLRDAGRVDSMLARLIDSMPDGRQQAWDGIVIPILRAARRNRPSSRRRLWMLERRLRTVVFSGAAADAPAHVQAVLDQGKGA